MTLVQQLSLVLRTLACPERLAIFLCIASGERGIASLAEVMAMSPDNIRRHAGKLADAGLVQAHYHGAQKGVTKYELAHCIAVRDEDIVINMRGYLITIGRQIQEPGK